MLLSLQNQVKQNVCAYLHRKQNEGCDMTLKVRLIVKIHFTSNVCYGQLTFFHHLCHLLHLSC